MVSLEGHSMKTYQKEEVGTSTGQRVLLRLLQVISMKWEVHHGHMANLEEVWMKMVHANYF